VALLPAESFDFTHGHTFDSDFCQGILHLFQFEWLDDRFDFFLGLLIQAGFRRTRLHKPKSSRARTGVPVELFARELMSLVGRNGHLRSSTADRGTVGTIRFYWLWHGEKTISTSEAGG
jgi:hypothetical protein